MALLKGREMSESGIFLKPEQSEQSDQSSSDDKYTSLKLDDLNTSSNASNNSFSSDSKHPIIYTKKKEQELQY